MAIEDIRYVWKWTIEKYTVVPTVPVSGPGMEAERGTRRVLKRFLQVKVYGEWRDVRDEGEI